MKYEDVVDVGEVTPFAQVVCLGEHKYSESCEIVLSDEEARRLAPNGEEVIYYGEYPQSIVESEMRMPLERVFSVRKDNPMMMSETGKRYTLFYGKEIKGCIEFKLGEGPKYVRVTPQKNLVVDGQEIEVRKPYWFKVQPIKWQRGKDGKYRTSVRLFVGRPSHVSIKDFPSEDEWRQRFDKWFNERFVREIVTDEDAGKSLETAKAVRRRSRYGVIVSEETMSVKEQIAFYVRTGKSFMLHGPSGCGKTRRIHDVDPDFTAVPFVKGCMPEQIVGKVCYPSGKSLLPIDQEGNAVDLPNGGVWMPPEWYVDICKKCEKEPDRMHVVFIDEVTNASVSSQSLLFQIVERKSVTGSHGKLPENCVVVLAGNSREESGAAYNMPEPLFRRAHGHIYLKPDIAEWLEWGSQKSTSHPEEEGRLNIHPLVSAFVAVYGKDCFYTEFDEDNPKYTMDPRGWEQISDIIYDNNGVIRRELLVSKMGKEFAATFFEFAKNPPITAEELISDDIEGLPIPQRPDEKLALIYGLRYTTERQVGKVRGFVYRYLGQESLAVFDKVWCEGNPERLLFLKRLDSKKRDSSGR